MALGFLDLPFLQKELRDGATHSPGMQCVNPQGLHVQGVALVKLEDRVQVPPLAARKSRDPAKEELWVSSLPFLARSPLDN